MLPVVAETAVVETGVDRWVGVPVSCMDVGGAHLHVHVPLQNPVVLDMLVVYTGKASGPPVVAVASSV